MFIIVSMVSLSQALMDDCDSTITVIRMQNKTKCYKLEIKN